MRAPSCLGNDPAVSSLPRKLQNGCQGILASLCKLSAAQKTKQTECKHIYPQAGHFPCCVLCIFCDLHCIRNAVTQGNTAILTTVNNAASHLQGVMDELLEYKSLKQGGSVSVPSNCHSILGLQLSSKHIKIRQGIFKLFTFLLLCLGSHDAAGFGTSQGM